METCHDCAQPAVGNCRFCQVLCCEDHLVWKCYQRDGSVVCAECLPRLRGDQVASYVAGKTIKWLTIVGFAPAMYCGMAFMYPEAPHLHTGYSQSQFGAAFIVCLLLGWLWHLWMKKIFKT